MTATQRKAQHIPDEVQSNCHAFHTSNRRLLPSRPWVAVNEPGVQYECDVCACDLTHTVRIKCADPECADDEGVDICPPCFCSGKEFKKHKRWHSYRVIVSYPYLSMSPTSADAIAGDEFISNIR